jgi:hypothetical protein
VSTSMIELKGVHTTIRTRSTVELVVIIITALENRPRYLDDLGG